MLTELRQKSLVWQLPTDVEVTPGQMLQRYFEVTGGSETVLDISEKLRTSPSDEVVKLGIEFWMVGVGLI